MSANRASALTPTKFVTLSGTQHVSSLEIKHIEWCDKDTMNLWHDLLQFITLD